MGGAGERLRTCSSLCIELRLYLHLIDRHWARWKKSTGLYARAEKRLAAAPAAALSGVAHDMTPSRTAPAEAPAGNVVYG
jgi:hypothetical protein